LAASKGSSQMSPARTLHRDGARAGRRRVLKAEMVREIERLRAMASAGARAELDEPCRAPTKASSSSEDRRGRSSSLKRRWTKKGRPERQQRGGTREHYVRIHPLANIFPLIEGRRFRRACRRQPGAGSPNKIHNRRRARPRRPAATGFVAAPWLRVGLTDTRRYCTATSDR